MKKEILKKLNNIARGTIISLHGKKYVKDTAIGSKTTYWFNMEDEDDNLTNEEVAELILSNNSR